MKRIALAVAATLLATAAQAQAPSITNVSRIDGVRNGQLVPKPRCSAGAVAQAIVTADVPNGAAHFSNASYKLIPVTAGWRLIITTDGRASDAPLSAAVETSCAL